MAVFNVAAFRPLDQFKKDVTEFAHYLKSTPSCEGSSGVFYPGEVEYLRELELRQRASKSTWERLRALARDYGLASELDLA